MDTAYSGIANVKNSEYMVREWTIVAYMVIKKSHNPLEK
jgi:hypothetical protein